MSPSLTTGQYKITSLVGNPIGRLSGEDFSMLPKKIVPLPKNFDEPRIWKIDQIANGKYHLKANGDIVGTMPDNLVWAFLSEDQIQGAEWRITHVPQHGEHAYIIETPDESNRKGWVADEKDESQVAVGSLGATFSIPPMYFPMVVFNIVPVLAQA